MSGEATQNDTIRELVRSLDVHEPGEAGHSERVSVYTTATGHQMGMGLDELVPLRQAAALHDIGKVSVDQATLRKLGDLSDDDLAQLRSHATLAMEVVSSFSWLQPALPMIKHHHERWDGTGYPDGLAGDAIPLGARVIGVCEAFDVLVTGSPWRAAVSEEDALAELDRCADTQFDPAVVAAFKTVQVLIQPVSMS